MDAIFRASDWLFLLLNGVSGRSALLDTLIALPVDNPLVKAGPIGACFVYAWYSGRDPGQNRARRSTLLVTLAALFVVLVTTKTMGDRIFLPRPYVHSQQMWHLEEGALAETERLDFRVPLAGDGRDRFEELRRGDVNGNDLVSFPSDHAGFFVALSLGIFLACRLVGLLALAWTFGAVLLTRIVTGLHSPLDIAAGAAIGASILLAAQWLARRWGRWALDPIAGWTERYSAVTAALVFVVAFEAVQTLEDVRDIAGRLIGA